MTVEVMSGTAIAGETPMADTIKTGITLIEGGTLNAGEPWTSFYKAAEIIRELRKTSAKESKYGSEGNRAHSDKVIDHHDQPRDVGGEG